MLEPIVGKVWLKPGREKPIENHHPWVFSGAIRNISDPRPDRGDIVDILDHANRWLGRAYINDTSQIVCRIISWRKNERIDEDFWRNKIGSAVERRLLLAEEPKTTAYRLINAEADLFPGLIVDKYDQYLVIQCLTYGIDVRKEQLVKQLKHQLEPIGIIERSDSSVRRKEGLTKVVGLRDGVGPSKDLVILENGLKFHADLRHGHKTGLYLDQRDNRAQICQPQYIGGCNVLNVFSYAGAFAVYAYAAGARNVVNIESSQTFIDQNKKNLLLNNINYVDDDFIQGDAFRILRDFANSGRIFDMIILDPPKFARTKANVPDACRGYKEINLLALRLLRPNGYLATFSCSGLVSAELFQKVLFGAAVDANREVQIISQLGQSQDHPILLTFPESAYLKGFLCRVL